MAVREQVNTTFLLAYPVMLSQLGQVAVGVADSMMVGRLGALELAASSLANSIFFVLLMFGIGISMGLTPLVSKAYGKGKTNQISRLFSNSLLINFLTSLVMLGLVLLFSCKYLLNCIAPPLRNRTIFPLCHSFFCADVIVTIRLQGVALHLVFVWHSRCWLCQISNRNISRWLT